MSEVLIFYACPCDHEFVLYDCDHYHPAPSHPCELNGCMEQGELTHALTVDDLADEMLRRILGNEDGTIAVFGV